ncbi:tetratricopeptide repeat protein [Listeria costaricensis]|uniref:tetratricopeptide repeat protein n=1 Tax=Listeria costaricensis TaxID=2026604 RepID=UPI000C07F55B|nr:tetratricopeptide repeat protein [Listeria costaricensis]
MKKDKSDTAKVIHFLPNGHFYFERGITAFREERMKEAIHYLKRASELEPGEPIILCQLAICYTEIGQFHKSNQLLRKILEALDPKMNYCYYFIANNFAYLKDFRRAMQYAGRYLDLEPEGEYQDEAEDLMNVLLEEMPIGESAENKFQKFEQEFYDYKKELNQYLAEEDNVSACKILEKVIDEKPHFWPAYNQLAALYFEQFKEAEALKTLNLLLDRSPGNLLGLADLFTYYYFKGDKEQAGALYSQLEAVVPILIHHREKLAIIHAMVGNYKAAWALFIDVEDLEVSERPKFYYYRAKTAFYLERFEEAEMMWEHFLALDVYEREAFPWQSQAEFADDAEVVLELLHAEEPDLHLLGVYALSVSAARAEIMLFHPLFDMSQWSYVEHLIMTEFEYLPDLYEQNCARLVDIWTLYRAQGIRLNRSNLAAFRAMVSWFSGAEQDYTARDLRELAAACYVYFFQKTTEEAARILEVDAHDILPFQS